MNKKIVYFMSVKHEESEDEKNWLEQMEPGSRFDKPKNDEDAKRIAGEIIGFFNSTLRPNESPRELIHVERHTTAIEVL